jgi:hypothetical protein
MAQYTTSIKAQGVPLVVEWDIDVDSPAIESIWVEDSAGDDISPLMSATAIHNIKVELSRQMNCMARETKAWKGQYNNV